MEFIIQIEKIKVSSCLEFFQPPVARPVYFRKGKRYTSEDVPLERKLYDGSRTMSPELKNSFSPFNVDGLTTFFSENIKDEKLNGIAATFDIPPAQDLSKPHLCSANVSTEGIRRQQRRRS